MRRFSNKTKENHHEAGRDHENWSTRKVSLGNLERTQTMKGKRYTTEEKIRMLRQADKGKTILEACRENNISEQTFHRWKREFGMIDVDQAKRMKELFEGERAVKTDAGGQNAGDRDPAGDPRIKMADVAYAR